MCTQTFPAPAHIIELFLMREMQMQNCLSFSRIPFTLHIIPKEGEGEMESRGGWRLLSLSLCPCLFGAFFLGLGPLPHKARRIAFLVRVATNGGVDGALSLSVLMRFWRGEVMPVNEEEFVWPPVTFWLKKNRNGAKPLQQSLNTEHIFRIIISYFDETLQDELTLLRQGALSCPAPALPPSIRKKEGRKALVAAVYGLGSAASAAALLTGIIHAWHLNAPIQNLSFPISLTAFFFAYLLHVLSEL